MRASDYQKLAPRTRSESKDNYPDDIHMVLGMLTEIGEIADVYKKNIAYGKDIDWINIKEELGDVMWYIANLCELHDWELEDIIETNINKLKARYSEKFTKEEALVRNLELERSILEQTPK